MLSQGFLIVMMINLMLCLLMFLQIYANDPHSPQNHHNFKTRETFKSLRASLRTFRAYPHNYQNNFISINLSDS